VRCYWYDWVPRLSRELDRHDAGLGAMWSLPDTVSPEELWDWLTAVDSPSRGGRILICTRSWDLADALREACHEQGYVTEVVRPTDGSWTRGKPTPAGDRFIVAIWEGTQCSPEEVDQLRQLTRDFPGTPILALLDFPRTQNLQQAEKAGAACVISKPFLLVDLFALVRQHAIKYDEPCRGVESAAASTID
jgi:DNA-binding response OmpR family regulator